jgi:hypothetical protein
VLQLSATTVTPGEVISRTISGGTDQSDIATIADMTLEKQVAGSWRSLYYLELTQANPQDTVATEGVAFPAIALPPTALKARIPDVPPGTYRIRQDVTSAAGPATLYATITVVAS